MSNSNHSNTTIRTIGFIAALAVLGTACGGAPDTADTLGTPAGIPGIELESIQLPADDQTDEQAFGSAAATTTTLEAAATPTPESNPTPTPTPTPTPSPTPAPTPTPEPAPAPEPPPVTEPAPEPNVAPVIDAMTITRHGLEVTVELAASDADSDPLTLSVLAVDDRTAEQFVLTEQTNSGTFVFDFQYMGTITLVSSVTDGQEQATEVGSIDIATLKRINIGVGDATVAKACIANTGTNTYAAAGDRSIIGLSTSDYNPNLYYSETHNPTMTLQEPGGQLFREPQSLEFEQNLGFSTHFEVHGTFGDIVVDYVDVQTEPGSFETTFRSPSNNACWLTVHYRTSVSDA